MEPTLDAAIARIFPRGSGETKVAGEFLPIETASAGEPGAQPPAPTPAPEAAVGAAAAPAGTASQVAGGTPGVDAELAAQARAAYLRAIEAQRTGNWARYGEEMKLVGELLDRMAAQRAQQPPQ